MSLVSIHHRLNVLHARGIADAIIDWQVKDGSGQLVPRYVSWEKGDREKVSSWFRYCMRSPQIRKTVDEQSGLVIIRRPIREQKWGEFGGIVPENPVDPYLRPDAPIDWNGKSTKYIFKGGPGAADLDFHPAVRVPIREGRTIPFFALEGTLKGDAMVSRGVGAFSCPSVTLWKSARLMHELPTLTRF